MTTRITRPVLRWHGGKWCLAKWIISNFAPHRIYTEAYGGAGSVLLRKPRSYAEVYNDLDGEVVNLFRLLQRPDTASLVKRRLEMTPFARQEFELAYEKTVDPIESACRLVIRSFMGFGSNGHNAENRTGFRAKSNRSGTIPAHDWKNYPDILEAIVDRLRGVVIENKEAKDVIRQHDGPETLHYVDPPYLAATRDPGNDYRFEMTNQQHQQLAETLNRCKGMVVLSGYPAAEYEMYYAGWHRIYKEAFADGARKRTEVLWMNEATYKNNGSLFA